MVYSMFIARFKKDTMAKITKIALQDGISKAEVIREAVHEYIMKKGI